MVEWNACSSLFSQNTNKKSNWTDRKGMELPIRNFNQNSNESEFGKNECKTHVFHNSIRYCHLNFLLKTQYILLHLITS